MNYNESLDYLKSISNRGSRPGLSRILEILKLLGEPQKSLKIIHVAGTNGKGSVCRMLESVLTEAGYKTGLFTSPCIDSETECFRIIKKNISESDFSETVSHIKTVEENMDDKPTSFEFETAMAVWYFYQKKCDVVILEVGMGGRLDATNISDTPVLSVITDVALDHMDYLGNTISEISSEKAGIIKPSCPTVFGGNNPEALNVIQTAANKLSSSLLLTKRENAEIISSGLKGSVFNYNEYTNLKIKLAGLYQPGNAAVAIDSIKILNKSGFNISKNSIYNGLAVTEWTGRFEIFSDNPPIIYDGSHNPQGMTATVNSIKEYFSGMKVNLIMGVMADKDYKKMVNIISPYINQVYTVTPNNQRALNGAELSDLFKKNNVNSEYQTDISKAVSSAVSFSNKSNTPLIILGTLYMYNDIKKSIISCIQ